MEAAEFLVKLCVQEKLIKLLYAGKDKADLLLRVCLAIHKLACPMLKRRDISPILASALDEVTKICLYVIALQSAEHGAEGTSLEHVDTIRQATRGARCLTKKAVLQSPYWKTLEGQYRNAEVSLETMGPEVKRMLAALQEEAVTTKQFEEVIQKLPSFRDNLRSVSVAPLEEALLQAMTMFLKTCVEQADTTENTKELSEFVTITNFAADMLRPPATDTKQSKSKGKCPFLVLSEKCKTTLAEVTEQLFRKQFERIYNVYASKEMQLMSTPDAHSVFVWLFLAVSGSGAHCLCVHPVTLNQHRFIKSSDDIQDLAELVAVTLRLYRKNITNSQLLSVIVNERRSYPSLSAVGACFLY